MEVEAISNTKDKKPSPGTLAKKRGPLHLIRVALFMLRRRSTGKSNSVHVDVATKGLWKRLVGSMRPLPLQHHQPLPSSVAACPTDPPVESFQDLLPSPISPKLPASPSSSSSECISQYASAENLQELGRSEGYNFDDEDEGGNIGDEMIDAKAEEFIAKFYEQMKLQRLYSVKCYNDMIERGLR